MPVINRRMASEWASRRRRARAEGLRITWLTDSHLWSVVDDQPNHPDATSGGSLYFYTAGKKMDQAIANITADPPHFTLHTGDLQERGRDFAFFMSYWDRVPGDKAFTVGNHDFAFTVGAGETKHDVAAAGLSRDTEPLIAGSRFNQSIALSGNGVNVRLILVDTNIQSSGLHDASSRGTLQPDALAWIEGEMAAAPEDIILIASHHGPHSYGLRFNKSQAEDLKVLVDAELAARPQRRIRGIFGHWHVQDYVQTFDTFGVEFPGLLAPCLVDLEHSSYLDLYVGVDGDLTWDYNRVSYW